MKIERHRFEVSEDIISSFEKKFNGKYLFWGTNIGDGNNLDNMPFYIFYSENPDEEKGHTHFFKVRIEDSSVYISKAFEGSKYMGVIIDDIFHFSRFRHDFHETKLGFIDGGQAYMRSSIDGEYKEFTLKELAKVVYGLG